MAKNKGKGFEDAIRDAFEKYPLDVSIDRIPDQVTKFKGSTNICDFVVFSSPYQYYIECKSVHGNTLSIHSEPKMGKDGKLHGFYGNIRDNQWEGLLRKSEIEGVIAGVMCWWIDYDQTWFIPIQVLEDAREYGEKSINIKHPYAQGYWFPISGEKKRVYFEYEVRDFLNHKWR